MRKGFFKSVIALMTGLMLAGCSISIPGPMPESVPTVQTEATGAVQTEAAGEFQIRPLEGEPTDYTVDDNWMLLDKEPDKDVDLFYIYPTVYEKEGGPDLSDVDDPLVRTLAQLVYSKTGSAIGAPTNVYAPYYRQTNLCKAMELSYDEYTEFNMGLQRTDIYAALDEYFEKYNNGRPFILAGHSQGSCLIKIILGEYMQAHPQYLDRMIAAYAVGFAITEDWLSEHPYLKFAEGPDDTGVIISWNAEGTGNKEAGDTLIVREGALSINPITWTRSDEKAEASENLGSRSIDTGKALSGVLDGSIKTIEDMDALWETTVPGVADAQVDLERGTVICTTSEDYNGNVNIFGPQSFHSHDYDFYYFNIQENAKQRIEAYFAKQGGSAADYSDKNNWLALPEIEKRYDTFYFYPTAYTDETEGAPVVCDIDEELMRDKAEDIYEQQAVVYEASTNVFAPFYRQMNMAAVKKTTAQERDETLNGLPKHDLFAALDYYFENLNDGRPFILAGHSQGSQMLTYILSEYMGAHPEYQERMIAAYVLGYSITEELLKDNPHLKFAEGPDDTGVIVSWNTEGAANKDAENFVVVDGAISINPLNWKRDETYASASENLGARILNADTDEYEIIPGAADARVDTERGVVVTKTDVIEPIDGSMGFGPASYHNGDYTLWFSNIRENVAVRCAAWYLNHEEHEIRPLTGEPTDYSDKENWLALPKAEKEADTFYIYPTSYMTKDKDAPTFCTVDDPGMRALSQANFAVNSLAYSGSTNVFAPYYRQASVYALQDLDGNVACDEVLSKEPRTDIYAALDYYFENLNNGRPFIIAGHSQGSMMTRIVLKEYMAAHPDYYERMIAAYPIGFSITKEDLYQYPHIRFAERADDTGVVISWNTEGPGNGDSRLVLPGAVSINPLNWKRDETYASVSENLGSFMPDENGKNQMIIPGVSDAQVDLERGVLISTNTDYSYIDTSKIADFPVFGDKSFHGCDYTFYFENIIENVKQRIEAYKAK